MKTLDGDILPPLPHPGGRPDHYKPEYADQARKLCALGATDDEIGDFFGVSRSTVYRWKHVYEEFGQAIRTAKEEADERVERSLYQKATGYNYVEKQAIKVKLEQHREGVEVVEVERHNVADTTAAIFWLKNRRREYWRDRHEVEHTGTVTKLLMADDELEAIASQASVKKDGDVS